MKRKSMITMLVIALMLVLSLTVLSACGKNKDDPPAKYSVTVTNGTGGGEYAEGATVTITANAPATGKEFTSWTLEGVTVENTSVDELTFTMPAGNVTATANYDFIDYTVTVTGGTANKTTAHYGDSITITAAAPETGKEFTSWTIEGVTVDDKTKAEITFTMPANAVTATANYGDVLYEFALENCTADKETAKFGEEVTFTADEIIGKRFDSWNIKGVDDLTGLDLTKSPLTITMPANDINVAAVLEDIDYTVTVNGGTANKTTAHYGDKVTITADDKTEIGQTFSRWEINMGLDSSGLELSNSELTFTMPAGDVKLTSIYIYNQYSITVEGGTSAPTKTNYGKEVTIEATVPTGQEFVKWTSEDGVAFAEETNAKTTFTMPAKAVTVTAVFKDIDYTVTVTGGTAQVNGGVASASVKAHYGEEVTITAEIPTGMSFAGWTLEGVTVNDKTKAELTFTMPANAVTATANYEYIDYNIKVTGGKAKVNGGVASASVKAHYGDSISIMAEIPTGMIFKGWTLKGVTAETSGFISSFTMPANDVTAKANYVYNNYKVTVNGGTADKTTAHYGEQVTITANEPGTNKEFIGWNSPDGVVFNNNTSIETTFIMSASNVTVNAVFGDINKYSVLVNYGTSGTSEAQTAYCGDPVTITAKNIEGKIFVRWEITGLDTEGLDLTKSPLTFTMPENNVTANAIYEDLITLTFEGSTAQSEPLTYRKGASKTFRIELGDSQELCEYDISLTNKSCTFKVYDSIGNEIEPTDNGDGSMRIAVTRQDTYTIRVTYEGTSSSSQCTIKITASSPTV